MARLFHEAIIKGEIDNRRSGRVTGRLWLVGQDGPIKLQLTGNCAADIAGCLLEFFNPEPMPQDVAPLHRLQTGSAMEMTASERLLNTAGAVCNGLHLAWKSDQDGQVSIESSSFKLRVSHLEWSVDDLAPQAPSALTGHTEFEWQAFLRHPEGVADDYFLAFSRYLDEGARQVESWPDYLPLPTSTDLWDDEDSLHDITPNPETEGIDWVRDDLGDVHHPFTLTCQQFSMSVWRYCHSLDLFTAPDDPDIRELVEQVERFSTRIGQALDGLAYDERPDYPYIVANLKRALGNLHQAMNAVYRVRQNSRLAARSDAFAQHLFTLREQAIELMTYFRQR